MKMGGEADNGEAVELLVAAGSWPMGARGTIIREDQDLVVVALSSAARQGQISVPPGWLRRQA